MNNPENANMTEPTIALRKPPALIGGGVSAVKIGSCTMPWKPSTNKVTKIHDNQNKPKIIADIAKPRPNLLVKRRLLYRL